MKTINNVYNIFSDIANNHYQINSFVYGDISQVEKIDEIQYPCLIVRPVTFEVLENTINHTYQVSVAGLVNEDETNRTEVWSDTLSIISDIVKIFRYSDEEYNLVNNPTFQPFYEKWSDEVSGVYGDFIIEFDFDNSECNVPIADFFQIGTTGVCAGVTILSSTGSIVTTVVSGGSYTLVANPFYTISNSDDSYSISTDTNYELPDIIVTDSDGSTFSWAAVQDVTCTLSNDTYLNFVFGIGATADYTQTIIAGETGIYTTQSLTNVTSVVYHKNGVTASLPITLVLTDTIRVIPTITNTAIEARVKMIGTY